MPRQATPNASFDANIAAIGATGRVRKLRGPSAHWLRRLEPESFDFIYVDGAHEAPHVLNDAVLAWPLLKLGGLMCFDDYGWAPELPALERPAPAIDALLAIYAGMLEVVDRGYQLTVRRIADFPAQA
jgi:predicted O-methyltransferase YrrM